MNTYLQALWRCGSAFDVWRHYQSVPAARSRTHASRADSGPASGQRLELGEGTQVLVRPIQLGDVDALQRAFKRLTPEQIRSRFFHTLTELPTPVAAALCDVDPDTTISLVATDTDGVEIRAEARVHIDGVSETAEFALAVDPEFTGKGLGFALLSRLIAECRDRHLHEIWGETQADNAQMLELARGLGFELQRETGDATHVRLTLPLQAMPESSSVSGAA